MVYKLKRRYLREHELSTSREEEEKIKEMKINKQICLSSLASFGCTRFIMT